MIDSVLKGTGNSRFLKSAVPAGTSWADALAMLQAGTFPIDFNGINTEGFQQVGTPLNKANLLKDATAAQIGLPPSTTPDGMFRALGNTGELHVWRKTVVVGSYYIGPAQGNYGCICRNTGSASFGVKIQYASEITVDGHENRNLVSPADMTIIANNSGITSPSTTSVTNTLKGKFIRLAGIPDGYQNSELKYAVGSVFYCPESISCFVKDAFNDGNYYICLDGIKNVPTKTENVVTYPVSTNPKAYQEGDDAKAAGYVVGDAVAMKLMYNGVGSGHYVAFNVSDSVSVTDSGEVSLVEKTSVAELTPNNTAQFSNMKGKFFVNRGRYQCSTEISDGVIYFIPSDATVNVSGDSGGSIITCDKVQPVTGYAAIPAGTTIEYLGKLGDKARVQVVSYVGTGTYGSGNETKIPIDFPPELLIIAIKDITRRTVYISVPRSGTGLYLSADGSTSIYGKRSTTVSYVDGKIRILCSDAFGQMNASGYTYIAVAMS